ncbi:DUF892 family protein [Mucilaginibacter roseus]|uniref:DUF892 family protein n=1 Tax=Mucilaginibacter roseus TaxID=1528868 RepID=A0ABS8U285_9SPHI|nr:DUF892 family protein [Mucilaginibacter roseus]MCD8740163.1 DUF892 family protein [Mucilaginibacter roseus]
MPSQNITSNQSDKLFTHNLNRLYFSKGYLLEKMPYLIGLASFGALKLGLEEFAGDLHNQVKRMDVIYALINEQPSDSNCNAIKAIIKDNFCLDEPQDNAMETDTDIMLYIQMLEQINISASRMLNLLAAKLGNNEIKQLLVECFDEAIDNDRLFELIAKEYLGVE